MWQLLFGDDIIARHIGKPALFHRAKFITARSASKVQTASGQIGAGGVRDLE